MLLNELLKRMDSRVAATPLFVGGAAGSATVTGVVEDSRKVKPGSLFVARPGAKADGAKYLADAASRGAIAAVVQSATVGVALPQVVVADAALAASVLANVFHGDPSKELKVLGVTGTNGKTTTTYLIRHMLNKIGQRCGMVGTVEIDDGQKTVESEMTTPGATDVGELLGKMAANGCKACAIEVSSHALHQRRTAGVTFAGAGFTNLTGDHLDYHGTMEEYAASKAILFAGLPAGSVAVVNGDHPWTPRLLRDCKARVVRFGFGAHGDYRASEIEVTAGGTSFTLHAPSGTARVSMSLVGRHNIENALVACGLVGEVFGLNAGQLAEGLSDAAGAPGRLQSVRLDPKTAMPFAVLVDYAHTDDALENVLTALRPLTVGKLRVVFGCGGDRDRTKRPRMARTAERLADVLYITSDNPRTEDPHGILREMAAGLIQMPPKQTSVEVDRKIAISAAISEASAGDVVLIAGKGHENYQIIGLTKHPFDDVEEATRVLSSRLRQSTQCIV